MATPVKGRADYFAPGDFNIACSMCGRKRKASYMVRNWQGLYRCPEHNEPRQPQDFARGVKDIMTVPFAQLQADNFTTTPGTFALRITPSPVTLAITGGALITLGGQTLQTLGGQTLVVEGGLFETASVGIIVPPWVVPRTIQWQFISGGVGIGISNPSSPWIMLSATTSPVSGVLQCTVTNNQGIDAGATETILTGVATVNVSG